MGYWSRPSAWVVGLAASVVVIVAGAVVLALRERSADTCHVLVIHGGGFKGGPPAFGSAVIHAMPDVRATDVDYPQGDVKGAYAEVMRIAYSMRDREPLVGYGESAGGTIAAWLVAWRLLDNATTVGAVMDLRGWLKESKVAPAQLGLSSEAEAWSYSPTRIYAKQRPVFQYQWSNDPFVSSDNGQVLPGSRFTLMHGFGHAYLGDAATVAAVRRACNAASGS